MVYWWREGGELMLADDEKVKELYVKIIKHYEKNGRLRIALSDIIGDYESVMPEIRRLEHLGFVTIVKSNDIEGDNIILNKVNP